nr:zinc finger, CCHC-type [Tanacetum cinerariifolium]
MTTSVGNNSVFRSFFEKQKLTGPNFIDWYKQLRLVLSIKDKENYLENPIPAAPVAPPRQQVPLEALTAYAAWVKGQKEAMYSKQAEQELLQIVREFYTSKQEEGQSVSSYVLKMKGYIKNLKRLGQPVGQNLAVSLILVFLNKDFDSFVQNYNMHGMGKTVNELHVMLKLHEETLPKKDDNPALHAIRAGRVWKNQKNKPHKAGKGSHGKAKGKMGNASNNASFASKPKTPPLPKKDNPTKDAICHQCGEVGHWRRNCLVYLAELMKKKKLSQGASTSGSTGKGVISVSRLFDAGFINHFDDNNVISVSKNNLAYFKAVPRDGIYEIDMSCSNTNYSSMYAITNKSAKINLDSSLLWHCCFGHISKKRIEKLQHDGLLNSINIESLGKCVSCMSEKMARKPYSHHVERAKDLLRLIHTDVCGLFKIVSRQGASYFVTFTDDFSRYGYVYLLKHKHEVFKTFKVFQKEVEKQLGKTIKSLHSDREGYPKKTMGYSFYSPSENKVFVARNAEFFESKLLDLKASGKPQSDINPIRKSSMTHRAPDRMYLYIDAEEHVLGDLDESANYKDALLDPESKKWLDAMNVEMQSMKDNDVWVLVELPPNSRTVG